MRSKEHIHMEGCFIFAWNADWRYFADWRNAGVCTSQGGRFPKFSLEGQAPRKSSKGPGDLGLCRVYHKRTCCSGVQTRAALMFLARLATSGEASKQCLELWEVVECSICDPRVGTTPGPPLLCPSLCESLFEACGGAFFSADPSTEVLIPCKDTVCARGKEWASSSQEFCKLAGFSVPNVQDKLRSLSTCYDGKVDRVDTDHVIEKRRPSRHRRRNGGYIKYVKKFFRRLTSGENVSWAVGGLVLTAGALYIRRRGLKPKNKNWNEVPTPRAKPAAGGPLSGTPKTLGKIARKAS